VNCPYESSPIRTNGQNQERHREEEEQGRQANGFAERANTMGNKDTLSVALNNHILMRFSNAMARAK